MSRTQHFKALLTDELERWIVRAMPLIIRRSLRSGLHGVYTRGAWDALPRQGFIIAANHHSWWDGYLAWLAQQRVAQPLSGMMGEAQLSRFRFFRRMGVFSHKEVREALRRLERGEVVFIFCEGRVRPSGQVEAVEKGVAFLADRANVPVYPLALRVVMRGAQHPEAFLVLGHKLEPTSDHAALNKEVKGSLNDLLQKIERTLQAADPEAPPPGFEAWLRGPKSFHERMGWVARLWGEGSEEKREKEEN